jgi:hypothetical protein
MKSFTLSWSPSAYISECSPNVNERFKIQLQELQSDALLVTGDFSGYSSPDCADYLANTVGSHFAINKEKVAVFSPGFKELGRFAYKHLGYATDEIVAIANKGSLTKIISAPGFEGGILRFRDDIVYVPILGLPDVSTYNWRRPSYPWFIEMLQEFRCSPASEWPEVANKLQETVFADLERRLKLAADHNPRHIVIWSYYTPFKRIYSIDSKIKLMSDLPNAYLGNPGIGAIIAKSASEHPNIKYLVLVDGKTHSTNNNSFTAGNLSVVMGSKMTKNKGQQEIAIHQFTF